MPHNGIASCIAKNQDCIHPADPAEYIAVILQFPFITTGNKMQRWREIKGTQMILALGYACGGWGARCVSLWLVSYVVQAESTAVYSSPETQAKCRAAPFFQKNKTKKL